MKLVPLGDKIVLKTVRSRRDDKIRYCFAGTGKRKTAGSRSYRCRTGRKYRWKRSSNAGKRGR